MTTTNFILQTNRLYFIDAVRAFAILMMLQGHFVDTLLAIEYRDPENMVYRTWKYFRGITAPTFFTISGLIFTYLLILAKKKGNVRKRMKKGLWRGFMLIGIGYALRIPIFQWMKLEFSSSILIIDVLQIIGLSIILIVVLYQVLLRRTLYFSILVLLAGIVIFVTEPLYRKSELQGIPLLFSNYLSKANGSVFTLLPWFGYMAFGAFIATLFYRYLKSEKFKPSIILGFVISGLFLIFFSSHALMLLYGQFDIDCFKGAAYFNYLFTRLGNVLILFAIFYAFEFIVKQPLVLRIGQKTLSIYVIHFIIIYGSFTGFGLNRIIGRTLDPLQATLGAVIFLSVVCFLSFYYMKPNVYIYKQIRKLIDKRKEQKT
ncbi:MAG: heparan-alpha-glucosaminide N-acetyltransferase domain-containing protein, partial [Bacteroidota bacterium]